MNAPFQRVVMPAVLAVLLGAGGWYMIKTPPTAVKAAAGHGDHGGHGAETVTLSDAKLSAAGIELAKAGPAVLQETLRLNGVIQPNQEALVQVTPRFPGVVRTLRRRIGDKVTKGDILASVESNQSLTSYDLAAPISGTVIERHAALGEYVGETKPIFVVADLSTVWADFSVFQRDFARVKPGNTVLVEVGDGGAPVEARISYVSPVGAADTQSALARAVVDSRDMRLRPGLFIAGKVILASRKAEISVKASALQTFEDRTVIFVRNGEVFEPRQVETGERDAENVEILFGLMPDETYAARNSFVVKAELAKGSATHEH